jgi:hypothetical protein
MFTGFIKRIVAPIVNQKDSIARLLEKSPKAVEMDVAHGFLAFFFEQSKK